MVGSMCEQNIRSMHDRLEWVACCAVACAPATEVHSRSGAHSLPSTIGYWPCMRWTNSLQTAEQREMSYCAVYSLSIQHEYIIAASTVAHECNFSQAPSSPPLVFTESNHFWLAAQQKQTHHRRQALIFISKLFCSLKLPIRFPMHLFNVKIIIVLHRIGQRRTNYWAFVSAEMHIIFAEWNWIGVMAISEYTLVFSNTSRDE